MKQSMVTNQRARIIKEYLGIVKCTAHVILSRLSAPVGKILRWTIVFVVQRTTVTLTKMYTMTSSSRLHEDNFHSVDMLRPDLDIQQIIFPLYTCPGLLAAERVNNVSKFSSIGFWIGSKVAIEFRFDGRFLKPWWSRNGETVEEVRSCNEKNWIK